MATIIRTEDATSAKAGAKAVVTEDGVIHGFLGGSCLQGAVLRTANEVLTARQPRLIRVKPTKDVASKLPLSLKVVGGREMMKNKIGVHALVWVGGWSEAESERAIAATAACGYDLIEVPLLDPRSIEPSITARQLESHGVGAAASLGLSFATDISSTDADTVARGEALLNDALSVTRDIGASYLGGVLFSALNKYAAPATADGRRNSVEVLARLAEKAKASGITIGLEAVNRYESNLINTGAQAVEFIKQTGSDHIKVHLDSYHMNIEDGDLAASIRTCGDLLGYFHVGESHRGYLGTGTIDFRTIFRTLTDIGYTGTITFESFSSAVVDPTLSTVLAVWRNLWSDSEDLAKHAKAFMESELYAATQRA